VANTIKPKRSYTATAIPSGLSAGEIAINITDARMWAGSSDGSSSVLISSLSFSDMQGTTTNITEGSNLYFTNARSRSAISAGTGITYNSTTGAITNASPDQTVVLTAGTGVSITGTYPNFTITNSSPSSGGTVTSVGLSLPSFIAVSNSPVTGSGTLTGTLATQLANVVFAGPSSGSSAAPTFRSLVAADIPLLNQNTSGTALKATNLVGGNSTTLLGAIPYQSSTDTTTLLAPNISTGKNFLSQTGTGTNGAIPAWTSLASSDVTTALGFTPYNSTNPNGYTNNTGTVTSVSALTLGTTGTDLSSTVATGTTTPAITLNVPTASATNRGALSSTDWSNFNTAYSNRITSLTTTGSSGSATLTANTLNIPTYTLSGLGGQPSSTNLTSLAGLSYVSASFVKMTASGTFSLDTNTYLTGNQSITLSGDVTGTGTTAITTTLATVSIAKGGTGQTTQQASINALTGTQSSGKYLRSDGTNATLSSIQAADVPTLNQNTSGSSASCTGNSATATSLAGGGAGQIPYNTASGATSFLAAGTAGQVLQSNGEAAPSWVSSSFSSAGSNIFLANNFGGL
jgi:hypothetical protein